MTKQGGGQSEPDDEQTAAAKPDKKFLPTQGVRLLTDFKNPLSHLSLTAMRQRRGMSGPSLSGSGEGADVEPDAWVPFPRTNLIDGVASFDPKQSLHRMVITTDAGIGKTTNMKWLCAAINRKGRDHSGQSGDKPQLAFLIYLDRLKATGKNFIEDYLLDELTRLKKYEWIKSDREAGIKVLRQLRNRGQLTLLFDGLDQATGSAVNVVEFLLSSDIWQSSRIVISARPHALRRHWKNLFAERLQEFRFVELEEFDPRQQKLFLGKTESGVLRWDLIHEEARKILTVPRVLEYILEVSDSNLSDLKTASHVYWYAIEKMIAEGLKDVNARSLGMKQDKTRKKPAKRATIRLARKLLCAIAFEMTATSDPGSDADKKSANFSLIEPGSFEAFSQKVFDRMRKPHYDPRKSDKTFDDFEADLDRLAAMNDVLQRGIFDVDQMEGLDQILWRNKSLQEFLAALWITKFCKKKDLRTLWDWIYHDDDPLSEQYYWIWRYAIDMPASEARSPEHWTRAMSVLYLPGDVQRKKYNSADTEDAEKIVKRPCELIYRTWHEMEQKAPAVIRKFQSEFELILQGDDERSKAAKQFVKQFQPIDGGTFQMGAPPEKQGLDEKSRQPYVDFHERYHDRPDEGAELLVSERSYAIGREGERVKASDQDWFRGALADDNADRFVSLYARKDETPVESSQTVTDFEMCKYPTLNGWLRLFKPQHGRCQPEYDRISKTEDHPAIFVSWFVAEIFTRWACWKGATCRLPGEKEWEYACKAGTPWDWNYWWEDEFDKNRCTANLSFDKGSTSKPSKFDLDTQNPISHRNPFGLVDISGNVQEWCEDAYQQQYEDQQILHPDFSSRVLRGGSWYIYPWFARSAFRNYDRPSYSGYDVGFRVVRAKHPNP